MKNIFILLTMIFTLSSCKSGINSHERLGWYFPHVPKGITIEEFYESPSPAMDHDYMWKIKIEHNAEFNKFTEQFTKPPSNTFIKPANQAKVIDSTDWFIEPQHPQWWKDIDFKKGKKHMHYITVVGSKGGERAHVLSMIDKKAGYVYIQAF